MTWNPATTLSKLKQSGRESIVVDGQKILMLWHNDQVHAIQAQCPHMKFPLTKGQINEQSQIVCPLHKSTFDLKTGEAICWSISPPIVGPLLGKLSKQKNLKIYPTKIEQDQILVELN